MRLALTLAIGFVLLLISRTVRHAIAHVIRETIGRYYDRHENGFTDTVAVLCWIFLISIPIAAIVGIYAGISWLSAQFD